jgi:hypothetical protein
MVFGYEHDDIGAMFEGSAEHRRGDGVVDDSGTPWQRQPRPGHSSINAVVKQ